MRPAWRDWIGAAVVAIAAVAIWFIAPDPTSGASGWTYLGWGLGGALAMVAASGYRLRRDPALLFVGAGAAAFAAEWFASTLASVTGVDPAWLLSLGLYGVVLGPLALAACLAGTVPWRDRRGRSPLRARTVMASVGLPLVAVAVLLSIEQGQPTTTQLRAISGLTAIVALVSAARSIARGGWHGWLGAGALSLVIASAATWIAIHLNATDRPAPEAVAWFTYMPSVAIVCVLIGVLAAQRADTSRMRRASDRAAQVMEGRAEIASVVAHDVRGPAGTMRSIAGSLRTSYARLDDDQRLEFVGMIEQESLRLLRVADQMSLGLRADAETLPMTLVTRDLEGAVLQGLHEAEVGPRDVRVSIDGSIRGAIDARWLAEAVRQGLDNAMKFSTEDAPIELRLRSADGAALIEIEDHGPGIPPEMRDAVFEKFCRWRPQGYEDTSGSGLGLFITRRIARAHGGDATVVDGVDGGTILQIRLPMEGAT